MHLSAIKSSLTRNDIFKIILLILFIVATNHQFLEQFQYFLVSDNPVRNSAIFLFIWLAAILACFKVAFIHQPWLRAMFALPVLVSAFANELYLTIGESNLQYSDITNFWLARSDYKSAVDSYWRLAITSSISVSPGFLAFAVPVKRKSTALRDAIIVVILALTVYSGIFTVVAIKGGAGAKGFPEQFKTLALLLNVLKDEYFEDFNSLRQAAPNNTAIAPSPPHVVFITDESVRGDYLSLNMPETKTTPYLRSIRDKIVNYGYAASGHNCSSFSNVMLRFGASQKNIYKSLQRNPSIWDFAKKSGYNTVYIDSQKAFGTYQNFMTLNERKFIDEFIQFDVDSVQKADDFTRKDIEAAITIKNILNRKTPQFVMLTKEGIHTPYEGKYPARFSIFKPHMSLDQTISRDLDKELLLNSYRNSIYWSVDYFFKTLTEGVDLTNVIIIYTSDHGQNLMEDGLATHCAAKNPETVGLVPLFIITENSLKSRLIEKQDLFFNKSSHFNIIPTILEIFNYPPSPKYDPSLFSAPDSERFFYSGDIRKQEEIKSHKITMEAKKQ